MYKRSIFIVTALFIFCLASTLTFSQTYGKIFTDSKANQKFGPVLKSVTLATSSFKELLNQTNNYIMLKVKDGNAIVLDSNRKVLHSSGTRINTLDKFTVYSVSVISELLKLGGSNQVLIEQREKVLTVSNGAYTMEVGAICPPFCPDED